VQGIVSILDDTHSQKVEALWDELETQFGLRYACVAYPHFSYQVSEGYDVPKVAAVLAGVTRVMKPFSVFTSGLGIFTGARPVLDIRIVRSAPLTAFHNAVWNAISPYASGLHAHHYGQPNWIPHITLAIQDLTHENLPDVIRLLSERPFNWEIQVDNVTLVLDAQGTRDEWVRYPFGG
jgi:2'-5' RNA ligase